MAKYGLPAIFLTVLSLWQPFRSSLAAQAVDTLPFFLSDHPDKAVNAGTKMTVSQITSLEKKWSYVVKFEKAAVSDIFMVYTWDDQYIYLPEDRTGHVPSYSLSPAIWMKRSMRVGESVTIPAREVTIYDDACLPKSAYTDPSVTITLQDHKTVNIDTISNVTNSIEEPGEPGNLGSQEVIIQRYERPNGIEIAYYSREWGLIMFELYSADGTSLKNRRVFNKIKNYVIYPDPGAICSSALRPPAFSPALPPSPLPNPADLNADGRVDIFDYNLLVSNFGNPYTIFDYNKLVENFGKT